MNSPWDVAGRAAEIDALWDQPTEVAYRQALVADLAPRLVGREIVEYGCGSGRIYAALHAAGALARCAYIGCDTSTAMLDLARARYPRAVWQTGDIETCDQRGSTVLCIQVLQHLPDWRPALANLLRVTKRVLYVVSWFSAGSRHFDATWGVWNNYLPYDAFVAACRVQGRVETTHIGGVATAVTVYKP